MPVLPDRETHDGIFTASIVHEVKTPLAALQAASASLRRNIDALLRAMLSHRVHAEPDLDRMIVLLSSALVSPPAEPPVTGLIPESSVTAAAERLAGAGLNRDQRQAAEAIVRGGWTGQIDRLAPILERSGVAPMLEILDAASRLRSNLRSIDASVARLAGIAGSLRREPGGVPGPAGSFEMKSCINDALDTLRHAVPPGARIEVRCDEGLRPCGDASRFAQVLTNLIGNALAALPSEGGEVLVEAVRDGEGAVVRVIDSGEGIHGEAQRSLFSPFFTTRGGGKGTGLGLFIAREIVESFGGGLTFSTRPGRTCFEARLPARDASRGEG
jgi:signal transduction histidine kinase